MALETKGPIWTPFPGRANPGALEPRGIFLSILIDIPYPDRTEPERQPLSRAPIERGDDGRHSFVQVGIWHD